MFICNVSLTFVPQISWLTLSNTTQPVSGFHSHVPHSRFGMVFGLHLSVCREHPQETQRKNASASVEPSGCKLCILWDVVLCIQTVGLTGERGSGNTVMREQRAWAGVVCLEKDNNNNNNNNNLKTSGRQYIRQRWVWEVFLRERGQWRETPSNNNNNNDNNFIYTAPLKTVYKVLHRESKQNKWNSKKPILHLKVYIKIKNKMENKK